MCPWTTQHIFTVRKLVWLFVLQSVCSCAPPSLSVKDQGDLSPVAGVRGNLSDMTGLPTRLLRGVVLRMQPMPSRSGAKITLFLAIMAGVVRLLYLEKLVHFDSWG